MLQALLNSLSPNQPLLSMQYGILSAPVRHVFMMGIVWYLTRQKRNPDLHIVEVGSWYGASALSWAQGLKLHNESKGRITCVDYWAPYFDRELHRDSIYVAMEHSLASGAAYEIFLHNIGTLPDTIKHCHMRGKSEEILPLLRDNAFDVVFIDADHTYQPVKRDLLASLRLVRDGGIICGDDLNVQLADADKDNAVKMSNRDFVRDPRTGRNFHPGVTLAVAEVLGQVSMWGGFWAMEKQGNEWKQISLKHMPIHFPEHFPKDAIERAEEHLNDIVIE